MTAKALFKNFASNSDKKLLTFGIIICLVSIMVLLGFIENRPSTQPNTVSILLLRSDGKLFRNQAVKFGSDDGTRCITSPCNDNEKRWSGKSDGSGKIRLHQDYIQLGGNVVTIGDTQNEYFIGTFAPQQGVKEYTVILEAKSRY